MSQIPIGWLIDRGGWNYPQLQQVDDGRWYTKPAQRQDMGTGWGRPDMFAGL